MSGPTPAQDRARTKSARAAVAKMNAAATALRNFLNACNACSDESASISLQGKGRDGREVLIENLTEFSGWLEDKYGSRA